MYYYYAKPVYYLSQFMLHIRPNYYYHPMFGYVAPPPPYNMLDLGLIFLY